MKKTYTRPALLFEDFRLTDAIAACTPGLHATHGDATEGSCYIPGESNFPANVFLETNASCAIYDVEFYEVMGVMLFSS